MYNSPPLCIGSPPPVLRGRDPTAVAVLMEDSAAVSGVLFAATALSLAHYTGNVAFDAIGSIGIGGRAAVRLAFCFNEITVL